MAIQDDKRENDIIALLRLQKGTTRSGVDAFYRFEENGQEYSAEIELKSTTNETVSTARDVGMDHIHKWRRRIWIIGYYNASGDTLLSLLALSSQDMDSWISGIENYIRPDFTIGQRAASKLNLEDLYTVCGKKRNYTIEDAQALHKMQWKKEQYEREKDLKEGYSPRKMLEILRLRALYLNQRGSTLNNPHITSGFLSQFKEREISPQQLEINEELNKFMDFIKDSWLAIINPNIHSRPL